MIMEMVNKSEIYLLKKILHRWTGRVNSSLIDPRVCSEETRSLAITITIKGINIDLHFQENPHKRWRTWLRWIDIMI